MLVRGQTNFIGNVKINVTYCEQEMLSKRRQSEKCSLSFANELCQVTVYRLQGRFLRTAARFLVNMFTAKRVNIVNVYTRKGEAPAQLHLPRLTFCSSQHACGVTGGAATHMQVRIAGRRRERKRMRDRGMGGGARNKYELMPCFTVATLRFTFH